MSDANYDSCHTGVNSLNRLLEAYPLEVEIKSKHEDNETEWRAVILTDYDEVVAKTAYKDTLPRAVYSAIETLGVIV